MYDSAFSKVSWNLGMRDSTSYILTSYNVLLCTSPYKETLLKLSIFNRFR